MSSAMKVPDRPTPALKDEECKGWQGEEWASYVYEVVFSHVCMHEKDKQTILWLLVDVQYKHTWMCYNEDAPAVHYNGYI